MVQALVLPQGGASQHSGATATQVANYTFAAEPKAVATQRKKYRDESAEEDPERKPVNIMHDRRIFRGNTYATQIQVVSNQPDPVELQRKAEAKRRAAARRKLEEERQPRTPSPVFGRKHIEVQTDLYLEEIKPEATEVTVFTQTDSFMDRPISPLFIPKKTGLDISTQVEDGELFNFDFEVSPILDVLVGKTIEQSLMEVMEEEELNILKKHQVEYEQKRAVALAETRRLEEAEIRREEEKTRRLEQAKQLQEAKLVASEIAAARAFSKSLVADIIPSAIQNLTKAGYFYDPVHREIEYTFMPWLKTRVDAVVDKHHIARRFVDAIVKKAVNEANKAASS